MDRIAAFDAFEFARRTLGLGMAAGAAVLAAGRAACAAPAAARNIVLVHGLFPIGDSASGLSEFRVESAADFARLIGKSPVPTQERLHPEGELRRSASAAECELREDFYGDPVYRGSFEGVSQPGPGR